MLLEELIHQPFDALDLLHCRVGVL